MSTGTFITFLAIAGTIAFGLSRLALSLRPNAARDRRAIADWERVRLRGFWRFAWRGPGVALAPLLAVQASAWLGSDSGGLTATAFVAFVLCLIPLGLIASRMKWSMLKSAAAEARAHQTGSAATRARP